MAGIPKKYGKAFTNLILVAIIVLGCIAVAPKIILLFMPFIIGWFLALLANPLVRFFEEKIKIRRKAGSALVIVSVIAGICFLIYVIGNRLVKEFLGFLRIMPDMWHDMEVEFVGFTQKWSKVIDSLPKEVVEKAEGLGETIGNEVSVIVGELSVPTADALGRFAGNIPGIFIAVIMCLLSAYFFVAEKDYVFYIFKKIMPSSWAKKCLLLKQTTIDVIVGYLKAQFKIEIWVYLIIAAGLMFLKVRYGYLIAIPIALLDILPVFGTGTVLVPWTIFKLLTGDYMYALGLLIIWGVSQLIRQIIQPKMIGDSMGMPPIPTLILLYVGYKFAGVVGMIVSVPLGILVLAMNDAGFFDNSKKSLHILWHGFHQFCQFTEEDLQGIQNQENTDIRSREDIDAKSSKERS